MRMSKIRSALLALALIGAAAPALAAGAASDARDITGTWDRYPMPGDGGLDPSVKARPQDVPPPPLKPQYLADYQAHMKAVDEANKAGHPIATGYTHCIPDGMPTMMMGMFPMEVLQTKNQVTIIQEAYNQVRRIYVGEKAPPIDDAEPGFWGHSGAQWNGDTLEVETVGIKDNVHFRDVPHSDQMRIFEKIRKIDANHFQDQITVVDPVYLTGPWSWTWMYKRRPGYKMMEYVCEDNREYADPATGLARLRIDTPAK